MSRELGLQDCVTIHGEVDEATKAVLLMEASALVIPNLPVHGDPEGFGLVALEAAAAGRYVFAADLEGLRDAVQEPIAGMLLPAGDADRWLRALSVACATPSILASQGMHAWQSLMDSDKTWSAMGRRYRQILDAIA